MAESESYPSLSSSSRPFPLPTVPEDTLHYALHPPAESEEPTALAVLITDFVYSLLTQPWLWNKDSWELKPVESTENDGETVLEGRMRVGDSVDDEWCVVWLLREVSKRWPDLIISIRDTDGEFLLIEAANELPAWVTPENAENRFWLYGGHLHLLPLEVQPTSSLRRIADVDDEETSLPVEEALQAVRTGKYRVDAIEAAVWNRIDKYPAALDTHIHRTNAYLPMGIAKALSVEPGLIQKAVEAFYVRDPAQLRAASRMTHFPPSPSILSSVIMTRPAYAQLQGQVFHPPRVFGPEWHVRDGAELDDERRWRDLGVKIATGFEIMYREGGKRTTTTKKETPGYDEFLRNLTRAGFFGDELEGSAKWKEREGRANRGWEEVRSEDVTSQRTSFAQQVDEAIARAAEPAPSTLAEDSASWLEVSPDELDGMLARMSGMAASEKPELAEEDGKALGDLAKKVEDFVGGQGDMQGARFIDELSDDDMDEDSDEEDAMTAEQRAEKVKSLVPPLKEGEWGRKVDSKSTSQANPNNNSASGASDPLPKIRPPLFAKEQYDGVEDVSDDSDDELPPAGTIGRLAAELKTGDAAGFDEVEKALKEQSKKGQRGLGDNIDEEMRQRVWGKKDDAKIVAIDDDDAREDGDNDDDDGDVDMGGEEEEFLRFTREALGISDEQWEGILSSRPFVPKQKAQSSSTDSRQPSKAPSSSTRPDRSAASAPPPPVQRGQQGPTLDSFEKVMAAMDAQLAYAKGGPDPSKSFEVLSKLPTEADIDDMSESDLEAMDRELKQVLKGAEEDGLGMDEDDPEEVEQLGEEGRREYRMMKDFLESYKSQAGASGVVGNLFGRLGEDARRKESKP